MQRIRTSRIIYGDLLEENYTVDDQYKKQGLYTAYYENGQLAIRCFYKDGKRDGLFEEYFEEGILLDAIVYKDDAPLFGKLGQDYLKEWNALHPQQEKEENLKKKPSFIKKALLPFFKKISNRERH